MDLTSASEPDGDGRFSSVEGSALNAREGNDLSDGRLNGDEVDKAPGDVFTLCRNIWTTAVPRPLWLEWDENTDDLPTA